MSFDSLQERLTALQETTAQARELIDRLASLKFQPGSVPLAAVVALGEDDDSVAAELCGEIGNMLREGDEDLELLAEEITDIRGGSDAARQKERLREGVARLEGEVKRCRASFHRAQLTARRSLEAARRLERELLLQSYTRAASTPSRSGANSPAPPAMPAPRRRQTHKTTGGYGDPLVAASSDLTVSLRRAHQAVTDELSRSIAVHEALHESTLKMKTLGSNYSRMDDMLRSSRDLVGVLLKSTKTDTWYLQTTFYMLLATLSWLVFRRFMYGPLWWLVWLPVRLVFRTSSTAVRLAGGKPDATMEVRVAGGEDAQSIRIIGVGEEGAVPTAQVGQIDKRAAESDKGDPDSMADQVGRIVDRIEEHVAQLDEAEGPAPTAADDGVAQEATGRFRDEL